MSKITKRTLPQLAPPGEGARERIHWDDALPGLGVRVLRSGARSWIVKWRVGGRQRFLTLGAVAGIGPDEARRLAGRIVTQGKLGIDARAEIEEKRQEAGDTVGRLVERYLVDAKNRLRPRSYVELARHLERHAKRLHGKPVAAVTQREVAELIDELASSSGPVASNRVRASLSACFSWAMRRGLAAANPVSATGKVASERPRERVLALGELRAIWTASDDGSYGQIVRLLILSGCRRDEVGGLRWSEVGEDGITLSAERVKNGRTHHLPLPLIAMQLVHGRDRVGEAVFALRGERFTGWARSKDALDRRLAKVRAARAGLDQPTSQELVQYALKPWRLHDLRRSVVTGMNEMGVAPHIVEAVVNHMSGHKAGVSGVYNKAVYAAEKRQALSRWADLLLEEDEPSKIIQLRPSA